MRMREERRERMNEVRISQIRNHKSPPKRKVSGVSPIKVREVKLKLPKIKMMRCVTSMNDEEINEATKKLKILASPLPQLSPLKIQKKISKTKKSNRHLLHNNFKNLNPKYDHLRQLRAKDVARRWLEIIGKNLVSRVREEARKNFNASIAAGKRLSLEDLKLLGTLKKRDYIKHMLKEEDENRRYLGKVQEKINLKHQEINTLMGELNDTTQ